MRCDAVAMQLRCDAMRLRCGCDAMRCGCDAVAMRCDAVGEAGLLSRTVATRPRRALVAGYQAARAAGREGEVSGQSHMPENMYPCSERVTQSPGKSNRPLLATGEGTGEPCLPVLLCDRRDAP